MTEKVKEKLAGSLTAETTELLPFLPELLQDFWELGSDPNAMIDLIERHIPLNQPIKILDLACGKGAVAVKIAQRLQAKVKGIDIMSAFVEFAKQKAAEYGVSDLCEFSAGDINEAAAQEKNYDLVILAAVGDVLGCPAETLDKLKQTIKPGGFILIDECYLSGDSAQKNIRYGYHEYLTEEEWADLFKQNGLDLIEAVKISDTSDLAALDSVTGMAAITKRANELIAKYPDKRDMFEGYIRSQQNEYNDLDDSLVGVIWLLQNP